VLLVKKYDSEVPMRHFKETLNYLQVSEETYWEVIDSWRSPHLWKKDGGNWVLRHPIWSEVKNAD
jgi:hypothetical protein